ncbi:TorF family putative porin [Bradyrhizobium lablabi]|nr:TorF family putative porin [Bradyrhizobium lablabi]
MRQRGAARVWHVSGSSIAAFVALSLAPMTGGMARAQTSEVSPGGAIGLGNRGWSASDPNRTTPANELEFSARVGAASDYIYRGTTLSDHGRAAGAAVEARFGALYAGTTVATVKLPTQPLAEFTYAAGIRPTIATIDFDFGVTYFAYPGERLPGETGGINYWEAVFRGDRKIGEQVRVAAGYAYSPNVSNTGAWSQYVAAGVGYDVPGRLLPPNLGVSFTTAAGYSWFGNQALALGGFPLPAYLNWQAGVTFTHKAFNLDLRYYDTNLSKENCFIFTGDPNARPGGRVDPVTNPAGLISNWCGATFVAKAWFAF